MYKILSKKLFYKLQLNGIMKTKLLSLFIFAAALFISANAKAQTTGTMTFTFTQGSPIDPSLQGGC
ncbi:MAG TPA: hypothetical protein VLR29_07450, partial [Flavobacterium sp.]|nr:hypothetical protein [Flavobacterium sp.]